MKKNLILVFSACVAMLSLYSCDKNTQPEQKADAKVQTLYAYDATSKTTLGTDWSVSWDSEDALSVFNAAAGSSSYSDNCRFVIDGSPSDGRFIKDAAQTDKSLVSGESSYDWYACSPWMQYGANPGGTKGYTIDRAPKQLGYNSNAHITSSDIMAGTAFGVADGTAPSIALHHVGALMKFTVTNNTGEAAAITGLALDATDGGKYITGSFTMNWGDSSTNPSLDATQMGSAKAYTCALSVVKASDPDAAIEETIANGASVDLYMMVAPFTIPAGKKIKLTISGSFGNLEMEKTMASAITFAAGTYNTSSISYTKPEYVVFTETFGANSIKTENVPSYGKAGLTTAVASHAADYAYSVTGNASIQASTAATNIASNYSACGIAPAYVRLPATTANSFICIKNITVDANTTYIFRYNKVKGSGASVTKFGWRDSSSSSWSYVNETTDEGTISQEFTTGDFTKIDIMVQSPSEGAHAPYTSVDLFKLIKK